VEIEVFGFFRGHCCWSHGVVIEREEGRRTLRLYHGHRYRIRGRSIYFIFSTLFFGHGPRPEASPRYRPHQTGLETDIHIWPSGALAHAVCRVAGMAWENEVFAAGAADRCAASHSHVNLVSAWRKKIRVQTSKLTSRPSMHEGSRANAFGPLTRLA
jgi:hypothetical protein